MKAQKKHKSQIVSLITLISLLSASFLFTASPADAAGSLTYRGIDVMKWTKDTLKNQPSDAQIDGIVSTIVNTIHPTHIAISIPMDPSADYPGSAPSPRDAYAFTQRWSDSIHNHGVKVLWRGTWSGIEGIYNFPKQVGTNRFPAGTAATAVTDGNSTWLGKTYQYIVNNPSFFQNGDIWAPLPERTENIFQDSTSFLSHGGAGIQTNYANFFKDLKTISDQAFAQIGKQPITGFTANNFTEVKSTWLPQSLFDAMGIIAIDHYAHSPADLDADLRFIYNLRKKPVFLQEWGDYWNEGMPESERAAYLNQIYGVLQNLVNDGVIVGFNYWGAWVGDNEGILTSLGGDNYGVNSRGQLVANFFAGNDLGGAPTQTSPPPAPAPAPEPTVTAPSPAPTNTSSSGSTTETPSAPAPTQNFVSANRPQTDTFQEPQGTVQNLTSFIPNTFSSGSLVLEGDGTIYLIRGSEKLGFTTMEAFLGLGYSLNNVKRGDTSRYAKSAHLLALASQSHPWGSWVLYRGTVYYSAPEGMIGIPTWEVFLKNGGRPELIVQANSEDLQLIARQSSQFHLIAYDARVIF